MVKDAVTEVVNECPPATDLAMPTHPLDLVVVDVENAVADPSVLVPASDWLDLATKTFARSVSPQFSCCAKSFRHGQFWQILGPERVGPFIPFVDGNHFAFLVVREHISPEATCLCAIYLL